MSKRPFCSQQRCYDPEYVRGMCYHHAVARADKLTRQLVLERDKVCVALSPKCVGPLHWAHILTRGMRTVRWDPENSVALCAGHHFYFTQRPHEWEDFVISFMGEGHYYALKRRANDSHISLMQRIADVIEERESA